MARSVALGRDDRADGLPVTRAQRITVLSYWRRYPERVGLMANRPWRRLLAQLRCQRGPCMLPACPHRAACDKLGIRSRFALRDDVRIA